jgi:hypothetical protein
MFLGDVLEDTVGVIHGVGDLRDLRMPRIEVRGSERPDELGGLIVFTVGCCRALGVGGGTFEVWPVCPGWLVS